MAGDGVLEPDKLLKRDKRQVLILVLQSLKKWERARAGIEPTAAAPTQPNCPGVSRSDHSAGSKEVASWRALELRSDWHGRLGVGRREKEGKKQAEEAARTNRRRTKKLNEQREEIDIDAEEGEENIDVEEREKEREREKLIFLSGCNVWPTSAFQIAFSGQSIQINQFFRYQDV